MSGRGKRKPTKRSDLTLPPPNLSKPRAGEIVAVIRRILEENGRDYRGAYIFTILCLLTVSLVYALSGPVATLWNRRKPAGGSPAPT